MARSNLLDKKLEDNLYPIKKAFMTQETSIHQGSQSLNFCASRYICNKRESFFSLYLKSYGFVTADRDSIRSKKMAIIKLTLLNQLDMILSNIAFAPRCNFNLISLSQLREIRILYYDYPKSIILKKAEIIIGSIQRKKNLFILNLQINVNKIIISQKRG